MGRRRRAARKGSVLATKVVETQGKGSVLATKAVETQGKVSHELSVPAQVVRVLQTPVRVIVCTEPPSTVTTSGWLSLIKL